MRRAGIMSPDSQRGLKANNRCFSQNAGDGSKIPSDFSWKLCVSSSPRITASWPAGMNVVSSAITLTCSWEAWEGSKRAVRVWNKGTVWGLGNLSFMLEKRASQWLSSRKSRPRRQSAPEDFSTKNCCWYRLLGSDIGKVTVPETGISAWFAAKSGRRAGWSWFWKSRGSRFRSRWLEHSVKRKHFFSARLANKFNIRESRSYEWGD